MASPGSAAAPRALCLLCALLLGGAIVRSSAAPSPAVPPFSTSGGRIIDSRGAHVQLSCVNWYGAHLESFVVNGLDQQPLAAIAQNISALGFNCVRLPFSTQLVVSNPVLRNATVLAANPSLLGASAMGALDAVIGALGHAGVFVILNNHIGRAGWCCSDSDGEGLWYSTDYSPSVFFDMWQLLARRYSAVPNVIGADLRNELRPAHGVSPTWGSGGSATDWAAAAEQCGNAVLKLAPHWLIVVEGLQYSTDFSRAATRPIVLAQPSQLAYSPHNYEWSQPVVSYDQFSQVLDSRWGVPLNGSAVWLGEFGTNSQSEWWEFARRYIKQRGLSWSYWAIDGWKRVGEEETFGVLNSDYRTLRYPWMMPDLSGIM